MAVEYTTVEEWVLVDSDGNYVVRADDSDLTEAYEEAHQPIGEAGGTRRVKLTVKVPLPTPIELCGEVECEESASALTCG